MKIFLSGIGGIGMSAYAQHMRLVGNEVSGSDRALSAITDDLEKDGIRVSPVQDGSAVPDDCDLFVYSEAVPDDAPERMIAREKGIREISYFEALGELTKGKNPIVIAGSHGKSSVTAMAAKVFADAGLDPNVVVGTRVPALGNKNWRKGKGDLWIVEGCEYRNSFHYLSPQTILLTNIDHDHHDAFPTEESYKDAFTSFVASLPADGTVFYHGADAQSADVAAKSGKNAVNVDDLPLPALSVPGEHMKKNAQLVLALARQRKIPDEKTLASLLSYEGSWRRFEIKGRTKEGAIVIDDYAHHPAEIRATIAATREKFPNQRIVCVFQPHTHERTIALWDEFASAFSGAEIVLLPNVYDARPMQGEKADAVKLAQDISQRSGSTTQGGMSLDETAVLLHENIVLEDDIILVMGAGNITQLAESLTRPSE